MENYAPYTHVTLVLDPEFGERAKAIATTNPLWVIGTPQNAAVIKEIWASGPQRFMNARTCFDPRPDRSQEESAAVCIGTVHDHHPDWKTFEIIGVPLSERLLDALLECAEGSAKETAAGFIFYRNTP